MFKNLNEYTAGDYGYCEIDDNFTPIDYCENCHEEVCVFCHDPETCD